MKREKLIGIFRRKAEARGYVFYEGEVQNINGTVRKYPAAWLIPPVVREKTGREEGTVTRRVVLHLMALEGVGGETNSGAGMGATAGDGTGIAPETSGPEALWEKLEGDALAIVSEVASSDDPRGDVCKVSNISCTPAGQSLTAHGEVSTTLTCDVTMWYYI